MNSDDLRALLLESGEFQAVKRNAQAILDRLNDTTAENARLSGRITNLEKRAAEQNTLINALNMRLAMLTGSGPTQRV